VLVPVARIAEESTFAVNESMDADRNIRMTFAHGFEMVQGGIEFRLSLMQAAADQNQWGRGAK
jgi:hypothetical protein